MEINYPPVDAAPVDAPVDPDAPLTEVHTDTWVVRLVIIGLMCISLAVVIGAVWLTSVGKDLPGEISTVGATAVGALAGVLASTRSNKQ